MYTNKTAIQRNKVLIHFGSVYVVGHIQLVYDMTQLFIIRYSFYAGGHIQLVYDTTQVFYQVFSLCCWPYSIGL